MTDFLRTAGSGGGPTVLLSHGAGMAMDAPWMTTLAEGLAARGFDVARFEFAYMAGRRTGGPRRPPPRMPVLEQEFHAAVTALDCAGPLILAGKSMGGRVASLVADDLAGQGRAQGLVCLGYPFHPTGRPEVLRTDHLAGLWTPALICQGTRDPFGTRDEVAGYALSDRIALHWLEDGDHDFRPRKAVTGLGIADHQQAACDAIQEWWQGQVRAQG